MARIDFSKIKIIVVKVGTSVLTSGENIIQKKNIEIIVDEIVKFIENKFKVIVVSSGAIAAGLEILGLKQKPKTLPKLQAAASIGQNKLMEMYSEIFGKKNKKVAQILLTREDLNNRGRYLNAKNTLFTILDYGIVPIINENDTVVVDEIRFGDNDRLSALVANLVGCDLLVIFQDLEGLYVDKNALTKIPKIKPRVDVPFGNKRVLIETVEDVTDELFDLVWRTKSWTTTGGMITKLQAAKIISSCGIPCIITRPKKGVVEKLLQGRSVGTYFCPSPTKVGARKSWLGFSSKPSGKIIVDNGAKQALVHKGKSLLPSGIVELEGNFQCGDVVVIIDKSGKEFARGLTNYSSKDIEKIKGLKTSQIEKVLGQKFYDEIIHRNNLIIFLTRP